MLDFIAIRILFFVGTFILIAFVFDKMLLALMIAVVATLLLSLILHLIKQKQCNISFNNFVFDCYILGSEFVYDKLLNLLDNFKKQDKYLTSDTELICYFEKNSNVSAEDLIALNQKAVKLNIDDIYIIYKRLDRSSLSILDKLPKKFYFVSLKKVFSILKKHNLVVLSSTKKFRQSPSVIFNLIFSRNNIKHYLFTAVILALISFITPLKNYYLILSAISCLLSILCLLPISKIKNTKHGKFDKL
ncbi:MAG: hypothetical protein RR454_03315 [Clostridia bacterium]